VVHLTDQAWPVATVGDFMAVAMLVVAYCCDNDYGAACNAKIENDRSLHRTLDQAVARPASVNHGMGRRPGQRTAPDAPAEGLPAGAARRVCGLT
jgi:hypothetical protein